jgi:acyl-CoA synthetase (AMP-forming)/AMP-acid ligase II
VFSVCANASAQQPLLPYKTPYELFDGYALDETALLMRARDGIVPRPLRLGAQIAPSIGIGPSLAEIGLSSTARLIVRGPGTPYNTEHKEGFQQTGYLAALEGENLRINGRIDQLAFVGGLSVSLNEVAAAILQTEGVAAVQVNAIADDVYGEVLEARVHFARSLESPQQKLSNLKKQLEASQIAPFKIPGYFVIDPTIVSQPSTVHAGEKKRAV